MSKAFERRTHGRGNPMVQVRLPYEEIESLVAISVSRGMKVAELARRYIRAGAERDKTRLAKKAAQLPNPLT
jgi:hypothetical protein